MHDERWTLGEAENGDVRLRDLKTGETLCYSGPRGLFDALGKLADWREAMSNKSHLERDARREAYQERERRRAARALDRWFATNFPIGGDTTVAVAGERFVEAVGDYVLSRVSRLPCESRGQGEHCDHWHGGGRCCRCHAPSDLQQKSHYGASGEGWPDGPRQCFNPQNHGPHVWWDHKAPEGESGRWECQGRSGAAHNADYGHGHDFQDAGDGLCKVCDEVHD